MEQKNTKTNALNYKYIVLSLIKHIQRNGLKERLELNLKKSLAIIKKNLNKEPLFILNRALENCKPFCEIKSVRISGSNYKVPVEISVKRQKTLVCRWILANTLSRSKTTELAANLANEIIDTYNYSSKTIKLCEDFHKVAESNKMYIRFYK